MKKDGRLIGIHGFKGSGKDTTALLIKDRIREVEGYVSTILHYADRLKVAASTIFGVGSSYFYDQDLKEKPLPLDWINITPREIMTGFHDGLVPLFGEDLFVSPVREEWDTWGKSGRLGAFIIADVRYDGRETNWIRQAGGTIVHVRRPGVSASSHSSEVGVSVGDGDFVIDNDGTLVDLREKVVAALCEIRGHFHG